MLTVTGVPARVAAGVVTGAGINAIPLQAPVTKPPDFPDLHEPPHSYRSEIQSVREARNGNPEESESRTTLRSYSYSYS